jgi:hypothetical protein
METTAPHPSRNASPAVDSHRPRFPAGTPASGAELPQVFPSAEAGSTVIRLAGTRSLACFITEELRFLCLELLL